MVTLSGTASAERIARLRLANASLRSAAAPEKIHTPGGRGGGSEFPGGLSPGG